MCVQRTVRLNFTGAASLNFVRQPQKKPKNGWGGGRWFQICYRGFHVYVREACCICKRGSLYISGGLCILVRGSFILEGVGVY